MSDAEDVVVASVVSEEKVWQFTFEQECRLEAMKAVGNILCAGRISPPSTYEIFELLHYLDHWMATGAIPRSPDPAPKLALFVGGKDATPIK